MVGCLTYIKDKSPYIKDFVGNLSAVYNKKNKSDDSKNLLMNLNKAERFMTVN